MAVKRIIKWSKWSDPFDNIVSNDAKEHDDKTYIDSYEEMELKRKRRPDDDNIGPVIVGPFGVIPINESNQPSKVFNFWMCDTNFDITREVRDIIEQTPGVETLEVYTRYRCRISIGRAFDEYDVQEEIEKRLSKPTNEPKLPSTPVSKLDMLKKHLDNKYKFWAIFILPDGQIDYQTGETQDSVKEIIAKYPKKAEILTSWERDNNDTTKASSQNGNKRRVQQSPR